MNDRVGRFLRSGEFEALNDKMNRFRPGRVCWVCKRPIRSAREHGGGRPGRYRPGQATRAAVRSIIRGWKHMHWICLGKNRDALDRVFGVKRPSRWDCAVLFRGDIDGLPFRIFMWRRRRGRFALNFGTYRVPSARGKNLVLGFHMTGPRWTRFVANIRGSKREANAVGFGSSGGLACSDPVYGYIREAVNTAEFRRRRFFMELRKDKALQGPVL